MIESQSMSSKEVIPGVRGIGMATGGRLVTNEEIANQLGKDVKAIDRYARKFGPRQRYWATENEVTSDLAVGAVRDALEMAGRSPKELTAIICGTDSSDYPGVALASIVQNKVGAPKEGVHHDVVAGCVGFLRALREVYLDLSSPFGKGGLQAAVGAEILSRNIHPSKRDTYVLFGDGAGALLIENVPDDQELKNKIKFAFITDGEHAGDLCVPAGGSKLPASKETVEKNLHIVHMNGPLVESVAVPRMAEAAKKVMEEARVTIGDISLFVIHQANYKMILDTVKLLGLPIKRVFINIDRMGNTSTASTPIVLKEAYKEGRLEPNKLVVIVAFGAGLNCGAAVIPTVGLPPKP